MAACGWLSDNVLLASDDLELQMRVEKAFDVRWSRAEFLPHSARHGQPDITAGQLHDWVVARIVAGGCRVPHGSWRRLRLALCEAGGGHPRTIRRDSRLNADLNLYRGG